MSRSLGRLLVLPLLLCSSASWGQEKKDNSGTNPAVLTRTLQLSNEYRWLPDGSYYDITNLRYTEPFLDGKMSLRLTVPLDGTNLSGDDEFGLGDLALKYSWVPYVSRRQALVFTSEATFPTASRVSIGGGKWVIAPGLTWAYFATPEIIIAPAYVQNVSFAGEDDRPDVNRGDFDLYFVYKPHGKKWWLTSDITASYDFETDRTPVSWELQFTRNLAVLDNGAAVNGYIRPGVGLGSDRGYDFNFEVGISLVGF